MTGSLVGTSAQFTDYVGNVSGSVTSTGSFGRLETAGVSNIGGVLSIPGFPNVSSSLAAAVAGGDNLGNHTATQDINLDGNNLTNVSSLTATGNISSSLSSTGSFGRLQVGSQIRLIEGADSFIKGGDFGIGTNTPVARLEIEDDGTSNSMLLKLTVDDTNVYGMVFGNDTFSTTDTDGGQHILSNDGTYIIRTIGSSTTTRIGAGLAYNNYKYLEIDFDSDTAEFTTTNISGSATSTGSFGAGQFAGNLTPNTDNIYNLGSSTNRWANAHIGDIELSNEGTEGNEVDGTTGSWTIQEGEDDLYLLNRKNGKKYKFKLEEIE